MEQLNFKPYDALEIAKAGYVPLMNSTLLELRQATNHVMDTDALLEDRLVLYSIVKKTIHLNVEIRHNRNRSYGAVLGGLGYTLERANDHFKEKFSIAAIIERTQPFAMVLQHTKSRDMMVQSIETMTKEALEVHTHEIEGIQVKLGLER